MLKIVATTVVSIIANVKLRFKKKKEEEEDKADHRQRLRYTCIYITRCAG